jgi:tetratricopeptide (TPR) repeat protein
MGAGSVALHIGASLATAEPLERPITFEILPFERAGPSIPGATAGADFVREDDPSATVQLALPGLLAAALIPYEYIKITAMPGSGRSMIQDTKADARSASSAQSEFFVRGFVNIRGKTAVINSNLASRVTGKSRRLNSVPMSIDRLNTGIELLAFLIASEIAREKNVTITRRSMVLACVLDNAKVPQLEQTVRAGIPSLVRMLSLEAGAKPINWSAANKKGCFPIRALKELAKREKADAIVAIGATSHVKQEPGGDDVQWAVYVAAEDKLIPMPDIGFNKKRVLLDEEKFLRQMATLLSAIVTVTGDWRTAEIPNATISASEYLNLAKETVADRRSQAALKDYFFTMAVSHSARLPDAEAGEAKLQLARIRLAQDRVGESAALLDEAAARNKGNFEIQLAQAELSLQRGQYDAAKTQYKELTRRFPASVETQERFATLLTLLNDEEGAAAAYRSLIDVAPDKSPVPYRGLAKISLAKGNWQGRERWLEAAAFLEAGIAKLKDEAQRAELRKELAALYADAGRAFYLKKEYPEALDFLGKSIATVPSVKAHFNRAATYSKQADKLDLMLADYQAVITLTESESPRLLTPEYIGSRLDLIETLTLQGKYEDAILRSDETLKIFTSNPETVSLEPVVRHIKLAAKIAGKVPSYRLDADELRTVAANSPRRYSFGSYFWIFDPIDEFVANGPDIPENLKCLFKQISESVQSKSERGNTKLEAACT